jgi:CheY-like chemotaxis protein
MLCRVAKQSVLVVHWKEAEVAPRLARVRDAGYTARWAGADGQVAGERLREKRPDAVVIDLGRLPSHGRALAGWLREHKDWRSLPLVIVAGDPEKTERLRADLPDAVYVDGWERVPAGLREALARGPLARPAKIDRPDYSGTPLAKKLGIRAGARVALLGAPAGFEKTLAPLPPDVRTGSRAHPEADVVVLFVRTRAELEKRLSGPAKALQPGSGLWIAWPKKSAGTSSDLDGNVVRTTGLATGLVDNKVCAIDALWSGLRFARRRAGPAARR